MSRDSKRPGSKSTRLVSSLYDYTNNFAASNGNTNRGMAAGTAATLLEMGLERLESRDLGRDSRSSMEYSEAEAELIDSVASSARDHKSKEEPSHFSDRFMERLVRNAMPQGSQETEELHKRMSDPAHSKRPSLSVRIFASNMKRLSGKMGPFFQFQYGVIHVVTWRRPTKTLSVLVLYTCVCMWPHLVLAFPLLGILFALLFPGYLHRHPMDTPDIIPVKRRGQTLWEFLNYSDDSSLFTDILHERNSLVEDDNQSSSSPPSVSEASEFDDGKSGDNKKLPTKKERASFVRSQVSLLVNMRDLQNLTTDLITSMDNLEQLVNDLTGFKDERLSTFLFFVVIVATYVVLFLGQFIPWRLIFISTGWIVLGMCHPNTKKFLVQFKKSKKKTEIQRVGADQDPQPKKEKKAPFWENFDREDIIVDDHPETRIVEVYELQSRDVLNQHWALYGYSKRLYEFSDSVRVAGKLPHIAKHITKVNPPKEWKFDFGFANNWKIDMRPQEFLRTRGIDQTYLEVDESATDGWIYDKIPVDQDTTREFRRRRLFRECYRYSRPYKPVHV